MRLTGPSVEGLSTRFWQGRKSGHRHGPHGCVGAALARLELQIALHTLLTRMPTLRLAVPADQLRWRPGMLMRTLEELPVTW